MYYRLMQVVVSFCFPFLFRTIAFFSFTYIYVADRKYFIIARSQAVVTDFVSLQWEFVDALRHINCLTREPEEVQIEFDGTEKS
jgi:hypothetical protein